MSEAIEFPVRNDEDGKAWFYLDHRRDIEEWVTLREVARDLVAEYLWALQSAMEELSIELHADVVALDVGQQPRLGLQREEWADSLADAQIVIEWNRRSFLVPGVNEWPYVAVRVEASTSPKHPAFAALASVRQRLQGSTNGPWPFWRYVELDASDGGLDPERLARACLADFRELWREAAPILDSLA